MSDCHALIVGLTNVDPAGYGGWDGRSGCTGCLKDVATISSILAASGFPPASLRTIVNADATCEALIDGLKSIASTARSGDLVVFYFTGHGGSVIDDNGDEADKFDETLCMYDGQLRDDRLNDAWKAFAAGVRIVMISDSCNSGTNFKMLPGGGREPLATRSIPPVEKPINLGKTDTAKMRAQLIHMGGCRDRLQSMGYDSGGAFTLALHSVLNGGDFTGNYRDMLDAIVTRVSNQTPQYNEYGPVKPEFRNQIPFTDVQAGDDDRDAPADGGSDGAVTIRHDGGMSITITVRIDGLASSARGGSGRGGHGRGGHGRGGHGRGGHGR